MAGSIVATPILALKRLIREAGYADGPEEALWVLTRSLPSMFARGPEASAAGPAQGGRQWACTAFMLTPDKRHHLITAPMNFPAEQYHEKVSITLGHPAHVAITRHPLLLRNTAHHDSFVKILQTFRAGSSMFAPLLWGDRYLGVMICACSVPDAFSEEDLFVHEAVASAGAALWMAHDGPAWLETINYADLPERTAGT